MNGGANIEMGGSNSGQLIEYVHSHHPRSWSCLHIAEGGKLDVRLYNCRSRIN